MHTVTAYKQAISEQAQKKAQPSKGNLALQLFSAAFYGTMAIAMNFVNKAALQNFPLSNVLLLNQMLLALLVLPTLKASSVILQMMSTVPRELSVCCLPLDLTERILGTTDFMPDVCPD